jgi:O-Antigen ligase
MLDRVLSVPPSAVLALAIPLVFLHATYQPTVSIGFGPTTVDVTLADLAVAAVAVVALLEGLRTGFAALTAGRWALLAAAAYAVLILVAVTYPLLRDEPYDWHVHLVSALKWAWYGLLAPATLLLVRRERDGVLLLQALVAWSVAATVWGLLQFLGLVAEFEGKRPGQREPSFVGIHDFAALSAAALVVGLVGLALAGRPLGGFGWTRVALAAGALGVVLSGAMTAVAGLWLAAATLLLVRRVPWRAAATVAVLVVVITAGTALMRGEALTRFAEFVGIRDENGDTGVESYAQRTLLAYIGAKIWLDHPVVGVGWQASDDEFAYGPHLEDARKRFPDEPAEAFPSPERPWGVQNAYVQTLADLGLVGLAVLAALGWAAVSAGRAGARASPLALVGLLWLLVAAGIWIGVGLVPGIPLAALTWIGLGLAISRV